HSLFAYRTRTVWLIAAVGLLTVTSSAKAELPLISVEGQPLAANVRRVVQAFDLLGLPFAEGLAARIEAAARERDPAQLQKLLDEQVLLAVAINPESRIKVIRGPATASIQQGGFTPMLIKVVNESTITKQLRIVSPQAGPVYAGAAALSLQRQQQTELG